MPPELPTPPNDTELPPAGPWTRRVALVASAVIAVSAVAMLFVAGFVPDKPGLAMLGFESVVLAAGIVGVLFGLGRFGAGPGLALFCLGGSVLLCSALGIFDMRMNLDRTMLAGVAALRVATGGSLVLLAAWEVLRRDSRSWGMLIKGVVLTGFVVGVIAGVVAARNTWVVQGAAGALEIARITGGLVVGLLLMVSGSVGVHLIIRAFQMGDHPRPTRPAGETSPAQAA